MNSEIASGERLFANKRSNACTIALNVLIFVLCALILFFFFFGSAIVDGTSMENTLIDGQRVMLQRHGYTVERGDIVTINVTENGEKKTLIKRIVATGEDKLLFVRSDDMHFIDLYICKKGKTHFSLYEEKYTKERMTYNEHFIIEKVPVMPYETRETIEGIDISNSDKNAVQAKIEANTIDVQKGKVYFLGDNRNNSSDSRHYGGIAAKNIIGKVIKIIEKNSAAEKFIDMLFPITGK